MFAVYKRKFEAFRKAISHWHIGRFSDKFAMVFSLPDFIDNTIFNNLFSVTHKKRGKTHEQYENGRLHQQIKNRNGKNHSALMSHLISMRTNRGFITLESRFLVFLPRLCENFLFQVYKFKFPSN